MLSRRAMLVLLQLLQAALQPWQPGGGGGGSADDSAQLPPHLQSFGQDLDRFSRHGDFRCAPHPVEHMLQSVLRWLAHAGRTEEINRELAENLAAQEPAEEEDISRVQASWRCRLAG